jgi:SOS-response transcriptional repressor LexA
VRAAQKFGIRPAWIEHGVLPMFESSAQASFHVAEQETEDNVTPIRPIAMVPLISSVRAGTWGEIEDHQAESEERVAVREVKTSAGAFALKVEGDSMTSDAAPTFPDGTVLIVEPGRAPKVGDYVVAKDTATQKATFKRLTTDGSRWYLKPLNSSYPTLEIDDPAKRVIGVVVEYWLGGKL